MGSCLHGSQVFQFVKEIQSLTNKQYKKIYVSDRFTIKNKKRNEDSSWFFFSSEIKSILAKTIL